VALSWAASSGATSYSVYEGTSSGGEGSTAIVTGVTGTSYTVSNLTNGTRYYFKVAAVNASGTSGLSNEATATPNLVYGTPMSITVPNYSFELDGTTGYITPQEWTFTGTDNGGEAADTYVSNAAISGKTGTYFWDPYVAGQATTPYGTETSMLTSAASLGTFAANTQYVLTVALGADAPASSSVGMILLANGTPVATYSSSAPGSGVLPTGSLSDFSLTFSTVNQPSVVGEKITIELVYTYSGQYGRYAYFNNVRLTKATAGP